MTSNSPHYLLFSEAGHDRQQSRAWRFVLQNVDTDSRFSAADSEPIDCGERLELLAVVRGLEAIDVPARVTLVTKSRYVSRGLKVGLAEWRASGWRWERFGKLVAIKDHDLWRRIDHALRFHQVECQAWQFEEDEQPVESPVESTNESASRSLPVVVGPRSRSRTVKRRFLATKLNTAANRWCPSPRRAIA